MSHALKTGFTTSARGQLYYSHWQPTANTGAECVLVALPFMEEMNRCRYMITMLAQQLAARGVGLICVDPYGTGDSEGDFSDTDWSALVDALVVSKTLANQHGYTRFDVVGIRLGALVAVDALRQIGEVNHLVFWQPQLNAKAMLTQLLRVKMASSLGRNDKTGSVSEFVQQSQNGEDIEVSGYAISPQLFDQLQNFSVDPLLASTTFPGVRWYSVIATAERKTSRADLKFVDALKGAGANVALKEIVGAPFWQAHERTLVPELVDNTAQEIVHHGS